jgi:hypothetical protein
MRNKPSEKTPEHEEEKISERDEVYSSVPSSSEVAPAIRFGYLVGRNSCIFPVSCNLELRRSKSTSKSNDQLADIGNYGVNRYVSNISKESDAD